MSPREARLALANLWVAVGAFALAAIVPLAIPLARARPGR